MSLPGQTIRFCTSADGARIAFATVGSGPPLVKAANWLNHLEFDWNSPVWRHWLGELARDHTLVRYDERGCGLSDWAAGEMSVDAWVRDLEAVVDALQLERFPLLGISQGAPIAIAYAVRHPERVSHLVLYGGYLRGRLHRGLTPKEMEERELMIHMVRARMGSGSSGFPPGLHDVVHSGRQPGADRLVQRAAAGLGDAGERGPHARGVRPDRRAEHRLPGPGADPGPSCQGRSAGALRRRPAHRDDDSGGAVRAPGQPQSSAARRGAGLAPIPVHGA